jgi:hypothetical protein
MIVSSLHHARPESGIPPEIDMIKLMGFLGATIGSYAGWALGARYGTMTAFSLSMVGTGIGIYAGRRVASSMLD